MADKTIEFRVVNDDNKVLGRVTLTRVEGNNTVDMAVYRADGSLQNDMRLYMDSIERQLPPSLRIAGMTDDEQIAEATKQAVEWAVEITGGATQDYLIEDGNRAVHAITYSDGAVALYPLMVVDGVASYDPSEFVKSVDASYHVTPPDEADSEGFRRLTVARASMPTHVVRWKPAE